MSDLKDFRAETTPYSIIRAQRTSGSNANDVTKWTVSTLQGAASAIFEVTGSTPFITFTLTGFGSVPSEVIQMDFHGPTAPADVTNNFLGNVQSYETPNCFSNFTPSTHKIKIQTATSNPADYYWIIKP